MSSDVVVLHHILRRAGKREKLMLGSLKDLCNTCKVSAESVLAEYFIIYERISVIFSRKNAGCHFRRELAYLTF